jgi:hypothetical protein
MLKNSTRRRWSGGTPKYGINLLDRLLKAESQREAKSALLRERILTRLEEVFRCEIVSKSLIDIRLRIYERPLIPIELFRQGRLWQNVMLL